MSVVPPYNGNGAGSSSPLTVAAMAQLLIRLEWAGSGVHFECPICRAGESRGHEEGCELDRAITALVEHSKTFSITIPDRHRLSDIQRGYVQRRIDYERRRAEERKEGS